MSKIFVTVGSTEFRELCKAVLDFEFCEAVASRGFTELNVQVGSSMVDDCLQVLRYKIDQKDEAVSFGASPVDSGLDDGSNFLGRLEYKSSNLNSTLIVSVFRYKTSLAADMESADIIISHAGSGSIIEGLELEKPLIVVVNDQLMNNHQVELAEELEAQGYLACTTPCKLLDTMRLHKIALHVLEPDKYKLKVWKRAPINKLNDILKETVGIL